MAEKAEIADSRLAAFVEPEKRDAHIVDIMIEERCPTWVNHWSWPVVRPVLFSMLGYRKALRWADAIKKLPSGDACFAYLDRALDLRVTSTGLERVPRTGRTVIVSNHPTGLADGSIVLAALKPVRTDIEIMANADACRVNPKFAEVIIPVEWVQDKRTIAKTKETLRRAAATFGAERLLMIFPSGALAQMRDGKLTDEPWLPTAVTLARKNKAPLTPLHINGRNSDLYYRFCKLNRELRDITLFHELLNKQGDKFHLTFGKQIPWEHLNGDPQAVTDHVRNYVENILPNDPDRPFEPPKPSE
ncbi:MAG: 1-acyl-sn-glycerol-3-phosphate acyltransferase [Hyphomonadaceae bacterium]|nr:1-acyl-sn-glycerol-3-phosphate acyltransferase [Hyphomonadaceae bacterium]MBP9234039.1 1-acyl-sn-glycerol-3-phosphate acyltransferase [Hyphomonadaceae bacterium]